MKIRIDVDCTPEEGRAFLGLPNVTPLQEAVMERVKEQLMSNLAAMDPETLLKTWMPLALQGMEQFQKSILSQFAGAMGGADKEGKGKGKPSS